MSAAVCYKCGGEPQYVGLTLHGGGVITKRPYCAGCRQFVNLPGVAPVLVLCSIGNCLQAATHSTSHGPGLGLSYCAFHRALLAVGAR